MKMNTFRQYGHPVLPGAKRGLGWGAYISYLGFFFSRGDFLWKQTSPFFCVHTIQKGTGIFERNGKKHEAGPGTVFVFFPGDRIRYRDFPETPWEYIWFRLDGENAEKSLASAGITRKRPAAKIANPGRLKTYLHEMSAAYADGSYPPLYPMTAACSCLDMISGSMIGKRIGPDRKSISDSFISIIESRMDPAPSICEVAESMKIDRSTLFRAFMREHGISPKRYLENIRIDKASELLSATGMSVKEISDSCGFVHPSHFGKVFRARTGKSPAEWRHARRR